MFTAHGRFSFTYGVKEMFDPTAFDNIKVVLEGAVYDLDMDGEIRIVDRNDLVNTAKMSRRFAINFQRNMPVASTVTARINLEAGIENLAAELLPEALSGHLSGCFIYLEFFFAHRHILDYGQIEKILSEIWGEGRKIDYEVTFYPLEGENKLHSSVKVEFNRLIQEDQMDDLTSMLSFMIETLDSLEAYLS